MWSYNETSASSTGATSSSSQVSFFDSNINGTNQHSSVSLDISQTVVFISAATSTTYLNPTNTTATLTATFNSVFSTFDSRVTRQISSNGGSEISTIASTGRTEWASRTSLTYTYLESSVSSIRNLGGGQTTTLTQYATSSRYTSFAAGSTDATITTFSSVSFSFTSIVSGVSSPGFPTGTTISSDVSTGSGTSTTTWIETFTYNSTTATFTTTANVATETTATRSSSYLSTGTSASGTTTLTVTTTASSADTVTSSTTTTAAVTSTSYVSTTFQMPCIVNTIVEFNTNEWGWRVTTSGSSDPAANGVSLTRTTFSASLGVTTVTSATFTRTGTASSTATFTSTSTTTATISSSRGTTSQSTYRVAQSGSNLPFTDTTKTATISYTTTTATTYTYNISGTRTASLAYFPSTDGSRVGSSTSTVTTTYSDGTSLSLLTFTRPQTTPFFTAISSTSQSINTIFANTSNTTNSVALTVASVSVQNSYSRDSSASIGAPSVNQVTIGAGWQASTFGREQSIGTNLASNTVSTISEVATGWPTTVKTPVAARDAASIAGSVPQTLRNIRTTTKFGGFGWVSGDGSTISQTVGVHRYTTNDSSTSGATEKSWSPASSTLAVPAGVALAAEPMPLVNSTSSSNGDSQFISFAAFPST